MMNKKKTWLICGLIMLLAGGITAFIFLTEPTAQKAGATKKTAMLVEVTSVKKGNFQPQIIATGSVQPSQEVMLSPRVSGEITRLTSQYVPGGRVRKGDVLLQIDPSDYRNTLQLRESDLQQARADLAIEQGLQEVARKDYELVDEMVKIGDEDLVLREPQLNAVKAQVAAAQAAVDQARLNLSRTTIRAPFDAHIINRNANLGSQVAPGDNLGRLVGMEEYWVMVTLPLSKTAYIALPSEENPGSEVQIADRKAWKEGAYRTGTVYQMVGALEDQTRMARLIISVPDPLGYQHDTVPGLIINSFVEVTINGDTLKNVVQLDRNHLRENETVWVMKENKLQIREVKVAFMDAKYAYLSEGLQDEDQVVTTNLSTVADGASLRTAADSTQNDSSASTKPAQNQSSPNADASP